MPEYITKEQAVEVVNTAFRHIYDSDSETVSLIDLQNEIIMTIEQHTEPADVALAVHARWECYRATETKTGFIDFFLLRCSHCGKFVSGEADYEYCPQCGARMDGDDQ